jgi:hypothetical protein
MCAEVDQQHSYTCDKKTLLYVGSRTHMQPLYVSDAVVKQRYLKWVYSYMVAGAIRIGVSLVFGVRVLKSAQGLRV